MKSLNLILGRALRLYPPTPIVARYAIETDHLGDVVVQPGQNIIISFIGIQHDARFRSNPWDIDIDAEMHSKISGSTMAFSIGPRVCGGKHFALVELITFLSVFLDLARFELTSGDPPIFHWKSQMLREGGQPVRVQWL